MHFICGPAYSGKRSAALTQYPTALVVSCFAGVPSIETAEVTVVEGMEYFVWHSLQQGKSLTDMQRDIAAWREKTKLVLVGSEIGSGLVPLEAKHRQWRDNVGFMYQWFVQQSTTVDYVWYSILQRRKG